MSLRPKYAAFREMAVLQVTKGMVILSQSISQGFFDIFLNLKKKKGPKRRCSLLISVFGRWRQEFSAILGKIGHLEMHENLSQNKIKYKYRHASVP